MPYRDNAALPARVRAHLPAHAQTIYRQAFNSAFRAFADPAKRRGEAGREEAAHRVAWAAVKRKYEKRDGEWWPQA
ncbi:MAG: ChaB family protein [Pseudomonadota bacterium]